MKQTKTKIKNRLDKLWREIIHLKGKCEICGTTGYLNGHHIIGRRALNTRWDIKNGVLLCPKHHTFGTQSAHQDPLWFHEWLEKSRKDDLDYLNEKRKECPRPYSIQELLDIEEELKIVLDAQN